MKWLYISGNVPSLKNGKEIARFGKPPNIHTRLVPSKRHKAYAKATGHAWKELAPEFRAMAEPLPKPLYVLMHFVRDSRRAWDFTNAVDTVQDLMVEYGWIEDDNVNEMFPLPANWKVAKAKAGVYISLLTPDLDYLGKLLD
jgi:hypothetical protein